MRGLVTYNKWPVTDLNWLDLRKRNWPVLTGSQGNWVLLLRVEPAGSQLFPRGNSICQPEPRISLCLVTQQPMESAGSR